MVRPVNTGNSPQHPVGAWIVSEDGGTSYQNPSMYRGNVNPNTVRPPSSPPAVAAPSREPPATVGQVFALINSLRSAPSSDHVNEGRAIAHRVLEANDCTPAIEGGLDLSRLQSALAQLKEPAPDPGDDEHADIEALRSRLPDLRRPEEHAPMRVLLWYMFRRWWLRVKPWGQWHDVKTIGNLVYQEHRSGRRRVTKIGGGHQPLARDWLAGGEFERRDNPTLRTLTGQTLEQLDAGCPVVVPPVSGKRRD